MTFIYPSLLVSSLNLTLYPHDFPHSSPSSSEMRSATETAAIRLGWVHAILPSMPRPAERHSFGIWVVFPDPVSPDIITT